jgi:hypothetical protein
MDRIFLAIIASALLLMIGAASLYVTRTADLMPQARTIGADYDCSSSAKRSPLLDHGATIHDCATFPHRSWCLADRN